MANGQQKAEQNVQAFLQWTTTMRPEDYEQMEFRGRLNRVEVAKAVGCSKSALNQNPRLRQLLEDLESQLREQDIFPEPDDKAAQTATEEPQRHDQGARQRDLNADRMNKLEQRIVELEAENQHLQKQLKGKMSRLGELSQVLAEMGYLL